MPIFSGGGGGGPAVGSYFPVASKTGVTVDTSTYTDPILGGAHKLTTLVFPADQSALAIALTGDAFPRYILAADATDGLYMGDGTQDAYSVGANLVVAGGVSANVQGVSGSDQGLLIHPAVSASAAPRLSQLSPKATITAGALSTVQLVSGTGAQILTTRDAETVTPCTFNPGAATTATVTVALSPDNVTYSTLGVVTEPAGVALDGTILLVKVRVPAGWYLKLTVNAQAVLGTTTYY